ncbi:MAG: HDOD domain-containing protein [Phycisphaerae bacterium]|nr:HDOD domain-containing protein [Phycisphaerae bacterium]
MSTSSATADSSQAIKLALARIGDIATLPEITSKIISVVDDPKSTARDLHNIIKNDPALATKILKVVNSAFYGLPGQVSDLDRAIVLLGLSAVKNIAISASISRLFTSEKLSDRFTARDVWRHSVAVGVVTRQFCCLIGKRAFSEEAFLAGLIHDLGLLVERQAFPDQLADVIRAASKCERPFCEIEQEIIGADHQALGAALAAKWKFPRPLQVVLGYHHNVTNLTEDHRLLPTVVYAADVLCCHERIGFHLTAENQTLDDLLLESVGLSENDVNTVRAELPEQIEAAEAVLMD